MKKLSASIVISIACLMLLPACLTPKGQQKSKTAADVGNQQNVQTTEQADANTPTADECVDFKALQPVTLSEEQIAEALKPVSDNLNYKCTETMSNAQADCLKSFSEDAANHPKLEEELSTASDYCRCIAENTVKKYGCEASVPIFENRTPEEGVKLDPVLSVCVSKYFPERMLSEEDAAKINRCKNLTTASEGIRERQAQPPVEPQLPVQPQPQQ